MVLFGSEFAIYEVWEFGLWLICRLVRWFCDWVSFFAMVNNILNTLQTNHSKLGFYENLPDDPSLVSVSNF